MWQWLNDPLVRAILRAVLTVVLGYLGSQTVPESEQAAVRAATLAAAGGQLVYSTAREKSQ